YPDPVAGAYAAFGREIGMDLHLRIACAASEACDAAMLRLAEMRVLGRGENEREAGGEIGPRPRRDPRLLEVGQGHVSIFEHLFRIELDPPRRRPEACGHAVARLGIFSMARLHRRTDAARFGAQGLERDPARSDLV